MQYREQSRSDNTDIEHEYNVDLFGRSSFTEFMDRKLNTIVRSAALPSAFKVGDVEACSTPRTVGGRRRDTGPLCAPAEETRHRRGFNQLGTPTRPPVNESIRGSHRA